MPEYPHPRQRWADACVSGAMLAPWLLLLLLALAAGQSAAAVENAAEVGEESTLPAATDDTDTETARPEESAAEDTGEATQIAQEAAKLAEAIAAGTVLEGMTMEQVVQARGEPVRKESIPPDAELWHYAQGEVAFSQGKVSYVSLAPRTTTTIRPADPSPGSGASRAGDKGTRLSEVSAPTSAVGDTYVYESRALGIGSSEPGADVTTRRTVIAAGRTVTLSSLSLVSRDAKPRTLEYDREWNLIAARNVSGSGLDYSPPLKYFDFPLYPGKTWRQTSIERNVDTGAVREHIISGRVGPWVEVTVPAGTFRAIQVELETELYDPNSGERITGADVSWYVPEVRRSVKSVMTTGGGGERLIQLMSYRLSHPADGK